MLSQESVFSVKVDFVLCSVKVSKFFGGTFGFLFFASLVSYIYTDLFCCSPVVDDYARSTFFNVSCVDRFFLTCGLVNHDKFKIVIASHEGKFKLALDEIGAVAVQIQGFQVCGAQWVGQFNSVGCTAIISDCLDVTNECIVRSGSAPFVERAIHVEVHEVD